MNARVYNLFLSSPLQGSHCVPIERNTLTEMNENVDILIARLGDPDRDMAGMYLYCSHRDVMCCSAIQGSFIFKL